MDARAGQYVKRKKRDGEVVCTCAAYDHPHRMMGGYCDGGGWVYTFFEEQMYGECRDCPHLVEDEMPRQCQVVEGLEPAKQCPELRAYIRYEGIKCYGKNK